MAQCYKLNTGVTFDIEDDDVLVTNMDTGFVAKGNKYSHEILVLMETPKTIEALVSELCKKYPEEHHQRIELSVPGVVEWSLKRGLIEEIQDQENG